MPSKRERYERSNMRGGLGVRKRLSEESLRDSYRLNGVRTGFAVARCFDKYGRWDLGYTIGVIVRKTASVVQVRWADTPEEIHTYDQGDARYEVDRGRWRVLGAVQGNPLDPDNPLASALTKLRQEHRVQASAIADTPPTEENEVKKEMSNAASERAAAQKALTNGDLKERETYTAKQVAVRCGTDSKTMRKFFRSNHSTVEPVGQGGRYEFDARDLPKIKREFTAWKSRGNSKQKPPPKPVTQVHTEREIADAKLEAEGDTSYDSHVQQVKTNPPVTETEEEEPTPIQDQREQEAADVVRSIHGEDHEPTAEEIEEAMRLEDSLNDDELFQPDLDDLDED